LREIASVEITDAQLEQAQHRFPYAPQKLAEAPNEAGVPCFYKMPAISLSPCCFLMFCVALVFEQTFPPSDEGGLLLPTDFREPLPVFHSRRVCASVRLDRVFYSKSNRVGRGLPSTGQWHSHVHTHLHPSLSVTMKLRSTETCLTSVVPCLGGDCAGKRQRRVFWTCCCWRTRRSV
jgi:hypothetical protein